MTSINVIYRPSSRSGRCEGSLCLRLIHRRRVKTITLGGCRLYAGEWDKTSQSIVYPADDCLRCARLKHIEGTISREKALVESYIATLKQQGHYSLNELAQAYRLEKDESSLSGYGQYQCLCLEKQGRMRTARAYRSAIRAFIAFNRDGDICLKDIDAWRMRGFELYLKERGKALNTISFYMRNLRSIYNKAVSNGIINAKVENPFARVYTGVSLTRKRALNIEEIGKLRCLDKNKLPAKLRDSLHLFLFCFYARGMSFIDMAYLRKDNIRGGLISYYRKKTGGLIEVRLTKELRELIDSFSSQTKYSPYVFPVITNDGKDARLQYENGLRYYNKHLKRLAKLSGIDKPLSSHWARHSWATIAKYKKLPLSVISEGLGHSNEKTTYIYLASFEQSQLDEANRRVARATSLPANPKGFFARI